MAVIIALTLLAVEMLFLAALWWSSQFLPIELTVWWQRQTSLLVYLPAIVFACFLVIGPAFFAGYCVWIWLASRLFGRDQLVETMEIMQSPNRLSKLDRQLIAHLTKR